MPLFKIIVWAIIFITQYSLLWQKPDDFSLANNAKLTLAKARLFYST